MRLVIPGTLPTMNQIIAASKRHHMQYSNMKNRDTNRVASLAREQKIGKFDKVNLVFTWYCKDRRRDKDGIMAGQKFVLDGLQKAGVIENDGWRQVGDITHKFAIDKKNPRVELELVEVIG